MGMNSEKHYRTTGGRIQSGAGCTSAAAPDVQGDWRREGGAEEVGVLPLCWWSRGLRSQLSTRAVRMVHVEGEEDALSFVRSSING